ncbi:MAG: hypothetical protein N2645_06865 [Clostridia bacterium]|nr:hypothetical protein [Clostridia bacterium]
MLPEKEEKTGKKEEKAISEEHMTRKDDPVQSLIRMTQAHIKRATRENDFLCCAFARLSLCYHQLHFLLSGLFFAEA